MISYPEINIPPLSRRGLFLSAGSGGRKPLRSLLCILFLSLSLFGASAQGDGGTTVKGLPSYYAPLCEILTEGGGGLPVDGNSAEFYMEGADFFRELEKSISQAREYIHIETYKFGSDALGQKILSLLKTKALEGVEVLLLYDWTCRTYEPPYYYDDMNTYFQAIPFNISVGNSLINVKPLDLAHRISTRDHRKIVTIDGKKAFCGGMNITETYLVFRDTHMSLQGPIVDELEKSFEEAWTYASGRSMPHSSEFYLGKSFPEVDGFPCQVGKVIVDGRWSTMKSALAWIFDNAKTSIRIESPYFAMDKVLVEKLAGAARRGVKVEIMVPEKTDTFQFMLDALNRLDLPLLKDAGATIQMYTESRFNHTKMILCDETVGILGSCNLDERSLRRNYEASIFLYGESILSRMNDIFEEDLHFCHSMTEEDVTKNKYYKNPLLRGAASALRSLL